MSTKLASAYRLKCSCNEYPWGKTGSESLSAVLCEKQRGYGNDGPKSDFKIDNDKAYAEMWFGTYPDLPSYVAETGEDLQDVIDRYPRELIGMETIHKFGHSKLPYLPKVLSIAKALPLQVHPNKDLAAKLHKEDPQQFTDPNHKPEIALALSKFEAFCGFKPLDEISELLRLEPLKQYLPKGASSSELTHDQLKEVVRKMLQADDANVRDTYKALTDLPKSKFGKATHIPELAPRLAGQYSEEDPGTLVALITMNYLVLQPGESIYIPADGIHAYLAGDIIECMARSNNVLNTGFCPRAERNNVDMFVSTLTFAPNSPEECMLKPQAYKRSKHGKTRLFSPPMSEFDLFETELKAGEKEEIGGAGGPTTLITTKGSAVLRIGDETHELNEGSVFFVAAAKKLEIESEAGVLIHAAFVEKATE